MKKVFSLLSLSVIGMMTACTPSTDQPTPAANTPTVSTAPAVKVDDTTYTCGGNVTDPGSSPVAERGVAVSLDPNPTIDDANDIKIAIGSGVGAFNTNIAPFVAGYTYHIRAYASNASGTTYGNDISVTPSGGGHPGACNVVEVNEDIKAPTTWVSGSVYVVKKWVNVNSPLVIQPGVIIKFVDANCGLSANAKITADASSTNPIIFTSYKDDNYCGDNNGDGAATTASKGDWGYVEMRGGQHGSVFRNCKFFYGGGNSGGNVIVVNTGTGNIHDFTFDNCTFAHTFGNGTSNKAAFAGGDMHDPSVSVVTNCVFYDNAVPIYITSSYALDPSNIYHNPANPSETNKYNGIFCFSYGLAGKTVAYMEDEVPYVLSQGLYTGGSGQLFKVGPNVIIKIPAGSGYEINGGVSNFSIDPTAIFTSDRDDAHGGDTNGDGNASTPGKGDWKGISVGSIWLQNNVFYATN
ncbi:MAG: hypothetical protein JST36_03680 [Bacteroidetes bacterium]|nr:hypothetical protein [Bacteroidota bacterium]